MVQTTGDTFLVSQTLDPNSEVIDKESPLYDSSVFPEDELLQSIEFLVPQTDDPTTMAFTVRAVLIGTFWSMLISVANTVFSFRSNVLAIGADIATILSYPMGAAWARFIPIGILNPGPFTLKEHALIYIMASCSTTPYGIENVVTQVYSKFMGNTSISFGHSLGFVLVTQFLGYGLSGLCRRFLVKPKAMWWPGNLSSIAILSSFHRVNEDGIALSENNKSTSVSRMRVFWYAFAGMFTYSWVPQFFAPVLQAISLLCFFGIGSLKGKPSGKMSTFNAVAASASNGVGVFGLSFDWAYIGSVYITSPFWAAFNYVGGGVFFQWILVPILFSLDVWGLDSLLTADRVNLNPMPNSLSLFSGNPNSSAYSLGSPLDANFLYNKSDNYNLNETAYIDVSPIRITGFYAITYGASFLAISSTISHVLLWHGGNVYRQAMARIVNSKFTEKHTQMMDSYPEIPDWMYLIFLVITTTAAFALSLWTPYSMPWWAIFLNLAISPLFILPFGIIQAISGYPLNIIMLAQMSVGLLLPGQTIANMTFQSWGYNTIAQALTLTQGLKLGQYLHIPPYALVFSQVWGTLINSISATLAAYFVMFNSGDLLERPDWQYSLYVGFYSSSGMMGAIGPARFFSSSGGDEDGERRGGYQPLLWCFLIGFIAPLIPWLGDRYIVQSRRWELVNFPLFFSLWGPGGYQSWFVTPLIVAYISQVWLAKRHKWVYERYLYVVGAAWDGANGLVVLVIAGLAMGGVSWTKWSVVNPNTDVVAIDYYCWAGANYDDYDCEWYLGQGLNTTAMGVDCLLE